MAAPVFIDAVNNTVVKATVGGTMTHVSCHSGDGSVRYLQFFDAEEATDVMLGTTPPKYVFVIPAGPDFVNIHGGMKFWRGICIAATGTPTGNGAITNAATVSLAVADR